MQPVIVDDKKRVRLPTATPGQSYAFEACSDGSIRLSPIETPPGSIRFEKKDGFTVLVSDRPICEATLKEALEELSGALNWLLWVKEVKSKTPPAAPGGEGI